MVESQDGCAFSITKQSKLAYWAFPYRLTWVQAPSILVIPPSLGVSLGLVVLEAPLPPHICTLASSLEEAGILPISRDS